MRSGLALIRGAHHADRAMGAVLEIEHDDHVREASRGGRRRDHEPVREILGMDV